MMKPLLPLLILLVGLTTAHGQIGAKSGKQSLVDWTQFKPSPSPAGKAFKDGLKFGLELSGSFKDGTPSQNDFRLVGNTRDLGSKIEATLRVYSVNLGREVFGKAYTTVGEDARRLGAKAADEIVQELTGVPGIASSRLVITGTQSGNKELYLLAADGSAPKRFTTDNSVAVEPEWGPNGRIVTYTSYHKHFPDAYRIDIQTNQRTPISDESGLNAGAVLSPDGRYVSLILSMSGKPELYIKPIPANPRALVNGQPKRITNTRPSAKSSPTWSPDGSQLAFVSDHEGSPQIYIVNRNGTGLRLITSGNESVEPSWGKNNLIAYAKRVNRQYVLTVYDPVSNRHRELQLDDADWKEPSWAPNGRHIACNRTANYKSDIYIVDTILRRTVRLTTGSGNWEAPSWSPK